jgi:hypothetical protein
VVWDGCPNFHYSVVISASGEGQRLRSIHLSRSYSMGPVKSWEFHFLRKKRNQILPHSVQLISLNKYWEELMKERLFLLKEA